jgi:hypothetical protein
MGLRTTARLRRALVAGGILAAMVAAGTVDGGRAAAASSVQTDPEPLSITVDPATGIQPGQQVQVTVNGAPDENVFVFQCASTVGEIDFCAPNGTVLVDAGERPTTVTFPVSDFIEPLTGGRWAYCGDCFITASAASSSQIVHAPIHVEPGPLAVRFLGDDDLVHEGGHAPTDLQDGDVLNTAVTGTRAVTTGLALCDASVAGTHHVFDGPCNPPAMVDAGSDAGRVRLTVASTFNGNDGSTVRCRRTNCVVALASTDGSIFLSEPVEFRSPGDITVEPSDGLVDGQAVQVTGHDVSPTYAGPPFWIFPETGNWVIAQCDAAVVDAPSIASVFDRCTNVPGRGEVDVPSRQAELDLGTAAVQASITSFLGRDVDCTAAPGTCVLTLLRLESNGSVTVLPAPLAFA